MSGLIKNPQSNAMRENVINVELFGAKGKGGNDTAAIQKGIDYLEQSGGGVLQFRRGAVYGITGTIYNKTGVHLVGQGRPAIRAIAPFEGAMVQFGYTTAAITAPDTHLCHDASIQGMEVDGADLVKAKEWDPDELLAAGLASALVYVWRKCTRVKVIDCDVHSAECDLIGAEDGADFLEVLDCDVHDATTTSAATQYINLMNIDGPANARIENNYGYNLRRVGYTPTSWGYALRFHSTDGSVAKNNRFTTGYHNILCDGRSNRIEMNDLSGCARTGIVLYHEPYGCRNNEVIGNTIDANGATGIREDDAGNTTVERNYIAFNTITNSTTNVVHRNRGTVVMGNNVRDVSGTRYPRLTVLGIAGLDGASDIASGSFVPATVVNQTNTTGAVISSIAFTRVGSVVNFSGKATMTMPAAGAYEFRFDPPVASNFTDDSDANGTANDNFSSYGNISALTSGSPRLIRVLGTAATAGAKTIRFCGSYAIKP